MFQPVEEPGVMGVPLRALPRMPEWYLLLVGLLIVSAMGLVWSPLAWAAVGVGIVLCASVARAWVDAGAALRSRPVPGRRGRVVLTWLHLMQPVARLWGRISGGLIPWRARGIRGVSRVCVPVRREKAVWSERWRGLDEWLGEVEGLMRQAGSSPVRGGRYDRWDLEVRGGWLGAGRALGTVEEHGRGRQLVRLKLWPHFKWDVLLMIGLVAAVVGGLLALTQAGVQLGLIAGGVLAGLGVVRAVWEAGAAMNVARVAAEALAKTWGCESARQADAAREESVGSEAGMTGANMADDLGPLPVAGK